MDTKKTKQKQIATLAILIIVSLTLHLYSHLWRVAPGQSDFLKHVLADLCYIPIFAGAIWFGIRGAVISSTVIAGFSIIFVILFPSGSSAEIRSDYIEIVFFLLVGGVSGIVLDKDRRMRKVMEETVKAERQRLYDVLETLPAYVALLTSDYQVPFANRTFRERFGESNGKPCYDFLFDRDEPCPDCETFKVLKTNAPLNWEWAGPDGRNYDIYDYPFKEADGSPMILEMGIDITERKQAEKKVQLQQEQLQLTNEELRASEEELQRQNEELRVAYEEIKAAEANVGRINRVYSVLSAINEAIVRIDNVDQLYKKSCRIAVEEGGLRMAWIGLVNEKTGMVEAMASDGVIDGYLKNIKIASGPDLFGKGPTGTAIRENRHVVCENIETDPHMEPWRKEALKRGYRSSAAFPLRLGYKVIGAFTLYSSELNFFNEEQVNLLSSLSNDLSFAIESIEKEKLRIKTEGALRLSEERYRDLFENVNTAAALFEPIMDDNGKLADMRCLAVNPMLEKVIGRSREDFEDKLYSEIFRLKERNPVFDMYEKVIVTGEPFKGELFSPALNGYYDTAIYRPSEGRLAIFFADITARKKAEEALRESEKRFRGLFETMITAYAHLEMIYDESGKPIDSRFLDVNPAWEKMMGMTREQAVGKTTLEIFPNMEPYWIETYAKVVETGEPVTFENYLSDTDKYYAVYAFRPAPGQYAVNFLDVTERKKAEEALRESEFRLERALKGGNLAFWDMDLRTGKTIRNDRWYEMLGYSHEDIDPSTATADEIVHPDDHPRLMKAINDHIEGKTPYYEIEFRMKSKSGNWVWVLSRAQAVKRDANGRALRVIGTHLDITDRKQAEEALKSERQRLFDVLETLPTMICLLSPDHHIVFANRGFREKFGESNDQRCHESCFGFDKPCEFCEAYRVLETGQPHHWEVNAPDGSVIDAYDFPFSDAGGSPLVLEMDIDITEEKKAKEALEKAIAYNRSLLEASMDPLVTIGPDGKIKDANEASESVTGRPRSELIGTDFSDYFTDPEQARASYQQVFREGFVRDYPLEIRRKDGHTTSVLYNASLYRDEAGKVIGIFAAARDMTERRKLEDALWRTNELLESMFSAVDVHLVYLDKDFNFIRVNRAYAEACGYPIDFFPGKNHFALYPNGENEAIFREVASSGKPFSVTAKPFEFPDHPERGTTYWDWSLHPIFEPDGSVGGLVLSLIDVTQRERTAHEISQKNTALAAANAELQQFAYVASHDLQEPLRMISSYLQLIEKRYKDKIDSDVNEFIDFAVDGAKRLQNMINSLLAYSRVGTRGMPPKKESAQAALEHALANLKVALDESKAKVIADDLPEVYADISQLAQIFQNLIGNSIKFRGNKPLRIKISAEPFEGQWMFKVKDNGIGIDKEYWSKIFNIFHRLHGPEYPGTGIGLALCKRIVERHGGSIWLESEPGKGTTFYFTMPRKLEI